MMSEVNRERSGSELVFSLLKTLMVGYHLWGTDSAVSLGDLAGCLRTTSTRVVDLIVYLAGEGLVVLDDGAGTVRLTESGARNLLYAVRPHAGDPPDR
jgi:Mn-dependent DtxR family transcriptional regulator